MYQKQLQTIGLSAGEAEIYEILLTLGPSIARDIQKKTSIKRGNVYNILELLVKKGLATADTTQAKTIFAPASPLGLQNVLAKREESVRQGRAQFADISDTLRSLYALVQDKPAVQFFEGADGIQKTLYDSLSAKSDIYTFADTEAVERSIKKLNQEYVKKRLARGIPKKIIALDSVFARSHYKATASAFTEVRLIPAKLNPFKTGMQIYNNTISYTTIAETKMIGVIIEDASIAQMHRSLFEYIWSTLPPFGATLPSSPTKPSAPKPTVPLTQPAANFPPRPIASNPAPLSPSQS